MSTVNIPNHSGLYTNNCFCNNQTISELSVVIQLHPDIFQTNQDTQTNLVSP